MKFSKTKALAERHLSYLGSISSSAKIAKSEKLGVMTFVVYLAPYNLSGKNVCAGATPECIAACLNESGRAIMDKENKILNARIRRTRLFYDDRETFMRILVSEIATAQKKAEKAGYEFSVRLNGTSDLSPEIFKLDGRNILEIFKDVQFYDYTKIANRMRLLDKYDNYHLTYSYTGRNAYETGKVLANHGTAAVVFDTPKGKELPKTWNGYPVIDGDISDVRYYDKPGVVVGLRFKRVKNQIDKVESIFIQNV